MSFRNYGKVWPYGSHKKVQEGLNTEESQACLSSSSAAKKHSKKILKKDKLELEQELYGFDDRDADARSTSSEVAPPVYSRKRDLIALLDEREKLEYRHA